MFIHESKPLRSLIKKGDIFLSCGLLIFSFLILWGIRQGQKEGEIADIYINNRLSRSVALNEKQTVELSGSAGQIIVQADDGKIWIHQVSCPDQLCKKMGKIGQAGQVIVCVPNELVIRIRGESSLQIDALSE